MILSESKILEIFHIEGGQGPTHGGDTHTWRKTTGGHPRRSSTEPRKSCTSTASSTFKACEDRPPTPWSTERLGLTPGLDAYSSNQPLFTRTTRPTRLRLTPALAF